jgi:hypothetical protein
MEQLSIDIFLSPCRALKCVFYSDDVFGLPTLQAKSVVAGPCRGCEKQVDIPSRKVKEA